MVPRDAGRWLGHRAVGLRERGAAEQERPAGLDRRVGVGAAGHERVAADREAGAAAGPDLALAGPDRRRTGVQPDLGRRARQQVRAVLLGELGRAHCGVRLVEEVVGHHQVEKSERREPAQQGTDHEPENTGHASLPNPALRRPTLPGAGLGTDSVGKHTFNGTTRGGNMASLDPETRARLDELRRHDRSGSYSSDRPVSAGDPTGTLTVTLDPTNRVATVSCLHLDDSLRTPGALDGAVRAAFVQASLQRIRESEAGRQAENRLTRPTPLRVERPPKRRLDDVLQSGRTPEPPDFEQSLAQLRRETGAAEGVADNECVTVTLDAGGSAGTVAADPGWLGNATGTNVAPRSPKRSNRPTESETDMSDGGLSGSRATCCASTRRSGATGPTTPRRRPA